MTMSCPYVVRQYVSDRAFDTNEVDLTTAHTNLEFSVGDFSWLQFWCDGQPFGITVAVGTQANIVSLDRWGGTPVVSGTKVYVTNDVRSGRSKLQLAFSRTVPLEKYLGGQISLTELAARLGSIDAFDRRGEVIFQDNFEDGINKWVLNPSGTGSSVSLSSNYARSRALSCKLVTGNSNGDLAEITKFVPYPSLTRIGFEFSVLTAETATYLIESRLYLYDGTTFYAFAVLFDKANTQLSYLAVGNVYTSFATGVNIHNVAYLFSTFKLAVDFNSKKYVRFILNNTSYDLSSYSPYSAANTTTAHLRATASMQTAANASKTGYVDDAIITRNEP